MVMKCGKMFRKTSTLDNHMRGHQETGSSQNFQSNLFGPVLLQKKPKLAGLRFPLQQIQNQESQTKPNRNHQDQNNQKDFPQKLASNFHQIQVNNQQVKTEAPPHQPWRDPPHLSQEAQRVRAGFASDHLNQPNLRQAGHIPTSLPLAVFNNLEAMVPIKEETPSYHPYVFNKMQGNMHNGLYEAPVTIQQDMHFNDAYRGLRF